MIVKTSLPKQRWTGEVSITFENKEEATTFFSLFNTAIVTEALCHVNPDFDCRKIYNMAYGLNVSCSTDVKAIAAELRNTI